MKQFIKDCFDESDDNDTTLIYASASIVKIEAI